MTKIRHCLLLLFLIVCLCIPAATELSADVRKLSVGILECAPICSSDPSKKNEAFLIEILTHIASREGWELDFISGTLSQNMDGLALGSIDLLAAVPYSPELASQLHFTRETVISTWAQVYAHPNISVQSMLDLNSLTVGILRNDSYGQNMRSTAGGLNLNCTFLEFTHYNEIFKALEKGWIDAGIVDRFYGNRNRNDYNIQETSIVFSPTEIRFATLKDRNDDLISALDYHLALLKKDPNSVYNKSLQEISTSSPDRRLINRFKWGLVIAFGLLVFLFFLNLLLRYQVRLKTAQLVEKNRELEDEIAHRISAEKQYRSIFENTGTATAIIERDMTLSMANEKFEELSGYLKGEIVGIKKYIDFIAEKDRARITDYHQKRRSGHSGIPAEYEFSFVDRKGVNKHIFVKVSMIPETEKIIASLIDMTERRQNERERKLLAKVIEQSSEGIYITDHNKIIRYVNPAFEKMSGYRGEELIGHDISVLPLPKEGNGHHKAASVDTAKPERMIKKRKDGVTYKTETRVTPIRNSSGRITSYVTIDRDVTVEERLENQLRQAQKMEAIGTLSGGIAHDFNNILTPIIGYTEMVLSQFPQGSDMNCKLDRVLTACYRAKDLIHQILTFSRRAEKERAPVDIGPHIKEALKLLRASIPSNIDIKTEFQKKPFTIMADVTEIHQVLLNLCSNAAHAMQEKGGTMTVALERFDIGMDSLRQYLDLAPGSYVKLTVTDTGYGIDAKTMERIFEPFFTTKKSGEGTGMGLSVVHGIVTSHGGTIRVYSEPEKGSTFTVYFPCFEKTDAPVTAVMNESYPKGNETILMVDDEEMIVDLNHEILEDLGYHVVTTTKSMEALKLFQDRPGYFDVVITDQTMPHLTGLELAQRMINLRSDLPIILCTGFSPLLQDEAVNKNGVNAVLMKPFSKSEIAYTLRSVLDKNVESGHRCSRKVS